MKKATCENNKVICENKEVKDAIILSSGVASSTGVLLFDENMSPVYVPDTQPDLKEVLELLNKLATACGAITTKVNGTPVPPDNAGEFTAIASEVMQKEGKLI